MDTKIEITSFKDAGIIRTEQASISYYQWKEAILPSVHFAYSKIDKVKLTALINKEVKILETYEELNDHQKELCKKYFNCMQPYDDILLFDQHNHFLCAVPYAFIDCYDCLDELDTLLFQLQHKEKKDFFYYYVLYYITKNLLYLDYISKSEQNYPKEVFALIKELTNQSKEEKLEKLRALCQFLSSNQNLFQPKELGILGNYRRESQKNHDEFIEKAVKNIEDNLSKKNLLVFHLESLSNETFINLRSFMPNLVKLMDKSMCFQNYYCSATSTMMVLSDLFFGNEFETDSFEHYMDINFDHTLSEHLFRILEQNGYKIYGITLDDTEREQNKFNLWNISGEKYDLVDSIDDFMKRIIDTMNESKKENKPFAIHISDSIMHCIIDILETSCANIFYEKLELACASLDLLIETFMAYLNKENILDDTVILGYADHGDDRWSRALNEGQTHATIPYRNLIWAPCFIYDSRIQPFLFENLASTIDLKWTILYMLGIEIQDDLAGKGINLFKDKNEYVHSRTLMLNQSETEEIKNYNIMRLNGFDGTEVKNKGYSIISESYNFVVSKYGVELFMQKIDALGYNNLLNFIEFDELLRPVKFNNHNAWRGHFRRILLTDVLVYDLLYHYNLLKKVLIERLTLKRSYVNNADAEHTFNFEYFNRIKERAYHWD